MDKGRIVVAWGPRRHVAHTSHKGKIVGKSNGIACGCQGIDTVPNLACLMTGNTVVGQDRLDVGKVFRPTRAGGHRRDCVGRLPWRNLDRRSNGCDPICCISDGNKVEL